MLQWVTSWTQARRLAWREWQRIQMRVKGALNVRLSGINAVYARWIRIDAPNRLPRLDGMLIEHRRGTIDLTRGGFKLEFVKHPDGIDTWTTGMEGQKPPVPVKPNAEDIPRATVVSTVAVASSGSVYLRLTIDAPEDASLTATVRYRVADTGGGVPGGWVEKINPDAVASGGVLVLTTDVVPADRELEAEAAFIAGSNKYGEWSVTQTVFSVSDPVAPGLVTPDPVSTGAGTALFSWTAPNSGNYAGAKIYVNTVNTFSTASFLGPIEYGAANASDTASRSLAAGTRYGWITAVNRSGVESAPAPTGAFTVL